MKEMKFDEFTLELAKELGFACEIVGERYRTYGYEIFVSSANEHEIHTFLLGYKFGKLSCEFTEEWAQRDMG